MITAAPFNINNPKKSTKRQTPHDLHNQTSICLPKSNRINANQSINMSMNMTRPIIDENIKLGYTDNTVQLTIQVDFKDHALSIATACHQARPIYDLKKDIFKKIGKQFPYTIDEMISNSYLILNGAQRIENDLLSLKTHGITNDNNLKNLALIIDMLYFPLENQIGSGQKMSQNDGSKPYIPLLQKVLAGNYHTSPHVEELMNMTEDQLKNIDNFTVFNDDGSIEFIGITDVTYVNID